MEDVLIVASVALIGGLAMNLQRQISAGRLVGIGLALVTVGWIAALAMMKSGPFPSAPGTAVGTGLFLTGILLLIPALTRMERERRQHRSRW
jgi:hypothetical protein